MKQFSFSIFSFILLLIMGVNINRSPSRKILFEDNFAYPNGKIPAIYWVEGNQRVKIVDQRLYVDSTPEENNSKDVQCTIWLNKVFEGNVHVEFDAHVLSAPKNENNINFFLFYKDNSGASLYDNKNDRVKGQYKGYHDLNGYIFTYVANGNPDTARFRLRDNPGFNLLSENQGYECKTSKTYRIEIKKTNNKIQFLVDGNVYLDVVDDKFNDVHNEGLIGFRTWRTELWFDNLKVSRL